MAAGDREGHGRAGGRGVRCKRRRGGSEEEVREGEERKEEEKENEVERAWW